MLPMLGSYAGITQVRPWASKDSIPPHTCSASSCLKPQTLSQHSLIPENTVPSPSGKQGTSVQSLEQRKEDSHTLGGFGVRQPGDLGFRKEKRLQDCSDGL